MTKAVSIILSSLLLSTTLFAEDTAEKINLQNQKVIKMAASEMSKQLPQTIDSYTKLVDIKAEETTLVFTYEINTGAKSDEVVIKEDKSRMKRAVTMGICRTSERFLKSNINISYVYTSAASKKKLFQFDVNKKECNYPRS